MAKKIKQEEQSQENPYEKKKCDCRDCKHAGPVENYMVACDVVGWKRSIGTRMCMHFVQKRRCSTR